MWHIIEQSLIVTWFYLLEFNTYSWSYCEWIIYAHYYKQEVCFFKILPQNNFSANVT